MIKKQIPTKRYFELLAEKENCKNQNKNFFTEPGNPSAELLDYQVILSDEIFFSDRTSYSELIEEYLEDKIYMIEFHFSFYKMWCQSRDRLEPLEQELRKNSIPTISVDSRADQYSKLIHLIFGSNESLTDGGFPDMPDEEHRTEIRDIYLEMKELLQEEN